MKFVYLIFFCAWPALAAGSRSAVPHVMCSSELVDVGSSKRDLERSGRRVRIAELAEQARTGDFRGIDELEDLVLSEVRPYLRGSLKGVPLDYICQETVSLLVRRLLKWDLQPSQFVYLLRQQSLLLAKPMSRKLRKESVLSEQDSRVTESMDRFDREFCPPPGFAGEGLIQSERLRAILSALDPLDERARKILGFRFSFSDEEGIRFQETPAQTLSQVGSAYNVEAETIRQAEARALKAVRHTLSASPTWSDEFVQPRPSPSTVLRKIIEDFYWQVRAGRATEAILPHFDFSSRLTLADGNEILGRARVLHYFEKNRLWEKPKLSTVNERVLYVERAQFARASDGKVLKRVFGDTWEWDPATQKVTSLTISRISETEYLPSKELVERFYQQLSDENATGLEETLAPNSTWVYREKKVRERDAIWQARQGLFSGEVVRIAVDSVDSTRVRVTRIVEKGPDKVAFDDLWARSSLTAPFYQIKTRLLGKTEGVGTPAEGISTEEPTDPPQ